MVLYTISTRMRDLGATTEKVEENSQPRARSYSCLIASCDDSFSRSICSVVCSSFFIIFTVSTKRLDLQTSAHLTGLHITKTAPKIIGSVKGIASDTKGEQGVKEQKKV